jgi:hypothetical protein
MAKVTTVNVRKATKVVKLGLFGLFEFSIDGSTSLVGSKLTSVDIPLFAGRYYIVLDAKLVGKRLFLGSIELR